MCSEYHLHHVLSEELTLHIYQPAVIHYLMKCMCSSHEPQRNSPDMLPQVRKEKCTFRVNSQMIRAKWIHYYIIYLIL